jgi:hypothetical protein
MIALPSLPLAIRALFSSFLILIGIGYLTALSYLFMVDVQPSRQAGERLVQGLNEKYHGSTSGTRLESALRGTMADKLPAAEREQIFQWIHAGAARESFAKVQPIFAQRCTPCHNPQSGMPIPSLASFEDVQKLTVIDTGVSVLQLTRVSHIHLFGISIIFLLTGAIFSLSATPMWFRVSLVVLPYLTIIADIGSWWATKYYDPLFAYIVILGGAFMGLALACQIFVSLWDMWIVPLKAYMRAKPLQI